MKKLSGVSFNQIKRENQTPNQVVGNHMQDLNSSTASMMPYIQRCSELMIRDSQMTGDEREELAKLQKSLVGSMEALSRSLYEITVNLKKADSGQQE